jgi:hypothetical protein
MYGMFLPLLFGRVGRWRTGSGFNNFIAAICFFREAAQLHDYILCLAAGIKEADGADFTVGAYFIDEELFHPIATKISASCSRPAFVPS